MDGEAKDPREESTIVNFLTSIISNCLLNVYHFIYWLV